MKHEQNSFFCKSFVKPLVDVSFQIHKNVRIFKMLVGMKEMWCVKRSVFFFGKLMTLNFDALP